MRHFSSTTALWRPRGARIAGIAWAPIFACVAGSAAGGTFQTGRSGAASWTITGDGGVTDGAGAKVRVNELSAISFGSLTLTDLTSTTMCSNNSFSIYGNHENEATLHVGAGGLMLHNSRILVRKGDVADHVGVALILNGNVTQDGQRFYLPLAGDGTGVWAPGKLIAHWTFDDGAGTRVTDAMGNVHGTLQGSDGTGAWIAGGRVGGALRLDSSQSQYVLAGSDNVVTNMPGEKTIAFWVRMEETGGSGRSNGFISIDRDGNDRWYLDTGTGTDTTDIRAFRADGGGGADLFRVSGVLEYDEWQHVVVTDDGTGSGGVKVFVNGELAGTRNSFEFFDLLPTTTLRLGAARHSGTLQYLNGDLDDFGIWSVALTEPQAAGLYQFATAKALGYDLGMLQQLFDHHERGPGGGELVLDGEWRWQYADGLDTGVGLLIRKDGHYYFQLDAAGTGLKAIPEPGTLALLAFGLIAISSARRRRGPACRAVCSPK